MTDIMIDFHSHILPDMDDGSKSVMQSLQMIAESAAQGVSHIVLTPHFYADGDDPNHFIERRHRRLQQLKEQLPSLSPELLLGAEVQYFEGISDMESLSHMRIQGTQCILVEMPFTKWNSRMVDDIIDIQGRRDYTVVLAHIERYFKWQDPDILGKLISQGVLFQSNANFFLRGFASRKAFRMLENGWIHLLGSDAHNTLSRPPNLGQAYKAISAKCGEQALRRLVRCGEHLLKDVIMPKAYAEVAEGKK